MGNVKELVRETRNIPAKESKRLELAYKASQAVLKAVGIMPAIQALLTNTYNDNWLQIMHPLVQELLRNHLSETIDLDQDEEESRDHD